MTSLPSETLEAMGRARDHLNATGGDYRLDGIFLRLGVGFGSRATFVFELVEVIDFVEQRVVAGLSPFVSH